mgnify:CR=1 FL=1
MDTIIGDRETLVVRLAEAQKREEHLKQVLLAIRNVNQLIVREKDKKNLIDKACENLTETLGYYNAWIAIMDHAGEKATMTASSGFNGGFKPMRKLLENGQYTKCMKQALDRNALIVTANPPEDCPDCPLAHQYEGRSGMTRRLEYEGNFYGIFCVSAPSEFVHNAEEQTLFEEVAGDISFALYKLEMEESKEAAEKETKNILESISDAFFALDNDLTVTYFNPAAERELGKKSEEVVGRNLFDVFPVARGSIFEKKYTEAIRTKRFLSFETYFDVPPYQNWFEVRVYPREKGISVYFLITTERKKNEWALKKNQELLKETQSIAHIGSWELDIAANRLSWSDEVYRILGIERDEFDGSYEQFLNFVHPDDRASVDSAYSKSIRENADGYEIEHRIIRPQSGEIRLVHEKCRNQKDADGTIIRSVGMVHDITEKRESEKALRSSEEKFRALVESSPMSILLMRNGKIVYANPAGADLLGYNRKEDLVGMNALETIDSRYHNVLRERIKSIQNGNDNSPIEVLLKRPDGESRWVISTSVSVEINGEPTAIIVGQDITDRKKTEEALRQSERQKNLILNSTAEMVAYYDLNLKVIWANRASAESAGKTREDLVGSHCYEIWHRRTSPCVGCPILKAHETGKPQEAEIKSPDGRYWHLRGYPVKDSKGNVTALVEFGQDISGRKQAEREKENLEEQYRQAQKMEAIGQLTGGVAHDFNNLLQIITGCTEMAIETLHEDAHPAIQPLKEVFKAGERATSLVQQLMLFSRRQIMRPEPLDIIKVVTDLLKMMRRVIGEHIQLKWEPGSKVLTIFADRGMIEQALMNLCVNARDAMPGGGTLTIKTEETFIEKEYLKDPLSIKPGRYVLLSVSDTGVGMDKKTIDHIFEPFFTTKEKGKGTGLGLATVYGIVKQHDGMIESFSEPGQGSTFMLYWPASEKRKKIADNSEEEAVSGGTETILVAEDDKIVRNLAQTILEREGYTVLTARNGVEALEIFKKDPEKIDLAVLDVIMPQLGGHEAFVEMQKKRQELKALFASGYSENAIHTDFVLKEGLTLIQKPYSRKNLLRTIRKVLDEL